MTSTKFKQTEPLAKTTSRDVVAASTAGALDRVGSNFTDADGFVLSAMPSGAQLNGPAAVRYLRTATPDSNDYLSNNADVDIGAVPAADYVSHSSMKSNSKIVVRVTPMSTAKDASRDSTTIAAMRKDADFFFPYASLQAVNELTEERFQLFEGFDAHKLLMFGSKPKIWSYQLMVLNGDRPPAGAPFTDEEYLAENMDFADELYRRYEKYYRGTKCVEMGMRCFLTYENRIVEGYLVMMSLPRNATMPTAIPMSLTIVVMNEHFTVDGLARQRDRTLNDVLNEEQAAIANLESLSPTELVNAKLTPEQRLALYAENQSDTAVAQSTAQEIREQAKRAQDLQREIAGTIDDITALQLNNDRALAEADTPLAEAAALSAQRSLQEEKDRLIAAQQDLAQTAALASGDVTLRGDAEQQSLLEDVTARLNTAEHVQRQGENNLKHAVEGDLTSAVQQDRQYADVLVTMPDGSRIVTTYDVTGPDGVSPDDTDATVVGDIVAVRDVTDSPEYAGVDDSTTTRQTRVFAP